MGGTTVTSARNPAQTSWIQNEHVGFLSIAKPPGQNDGINDLANRQMAQIHVKMGEGIGIDHQNSDNNGLSIKAAKSDLKYYSRRNKYKRMEYV